MADKSTGWILWSRDGQTRDEGTTRWDPRKGAKSEANREPEDKSAPEATEVAPLSPAPEGARRGGRRPQNGSQRTLVDEIIENRSVEIEYQAVSDIRHGQVVGFEALSRGPQGPLRSPLHLFAAARAVGRLGELDWICRAAAFQGMLDADLPPSVSLFVNVEPDSLIEPCPDDVLKTIWQAEATLRVFVDITGRALSRHPREALETVRLARAAKWGVALNDIEYSSAGMALLPTIEPDVVKLNYQILASGLTPVAAATMATIAEAEHTGAALLLERVEDTSATMTGRAIGAAYQQGRLLGLEGPLPKRLPTPLAPLPMLHGDPPEQMQTPWAVLDKSGVRHTPDVDQTGLDHLIATVATRACVGEQPPMVAWITPLGGEVRPDTQRMLGLMLDRCPLILLAGPNVSMWNDWRVRAGNVTGDHPLAREWCFLLLSPSTAMVVAARRQDATGVQGLWDVMVSQNQDVCRAVVRELLHTIDTLPGGVYHAEY